MLTSVQTPISWLLISNFAPLSEEVKKQLYDKIQPYKIFEPSGISIMGCVLMKWKHFEESVKYSVDEYNAMDKSKLFKEKEVYFVNKPEINKCESVGYLYSAEGKKERQKPIEQYDDLDLELIKSVLSGSNDCRKIELKGLHSYGGYYGFFRPDLDEVMKLLYNQISFTDLCEAKRIYVTTDAHGDGQINLVYDNEADRHRAITTVWLMN